MGYLNGGSASSLPARSRREIMHRDVRGLEEIPVFVLKANTALDVVHVFTRKTFEVPKEVFCLVIKVRDLNSA